MQKLENLIISLFKHATLIFMYSYFNRYFHEFQNINLAYFDNCQINLIQNNYNSGLTKMQPSSKTHNSFYHFLAYCVSFIGYGAIFTGLGPLIPYLAEKQGVLETDYSFLFLYRAIGFVIGSIIAKFIEKYLNFHQTLMTLSTLLFLCLTVFSVETSMFMQGIEVFMASIFCAMTQIVLNVSILTAHTGENQEFYIQIGHGMFGVGGLISPLVVYYFQQSTYFYIGLLMVLVVPAYYLLETPEKFKHALASQLLQSGNFADQIKRISQRVSKKSQSSEHEVQKKSTILYLLSFMFFIYIGQEVAFGGWISSYSVLNNVATKQHATMFSSLFWGFMTLFRFVFAFIREKPSRKLQFLIIGQILLSVSVLILTEIFGMYLIATYLSSMMLGMTLSASYGLFLVLPFEYGMKLSCTESSGFLMYGQLGQATITMFVGYLMGWISPSMLFWSILLCSCILYWGTNKIIIILSHDKENFEKQIQMTKIRRYVYDGIDGKGSDLKTLKTKMLSNKIGQ